MDKYLHLCGCKTPLRYEGNYRRSSLQDKKTDFPGSGAGSGAGGTRGLFLQHFLGGRGEGHGAAGFGCWRGCHPTAPLGEFKRVPTDFFALQLPPVIHFTWESEEEKCRIQKHVQSRFLEIPRGKALYGSATLENTFSFGEFLFPCWCTLVAVVVCLFPFKKPLYFQLYLWGGSSPATLNCWLSTGCHPTMCARTTEKIVSAI